MTRGYYNEGELLDRKITPVDRELRGLKVPEPEKDTEVVRSMDYKRIVPGESQPGNDGGRLHVTKAWKPKGRK